MRISDLLRRKGNLVVSVKPEQSVTELLDLLAEHSVGALIVSSDGTTLEGIVSERDVVRRLQQFGPELLNSPVRDIMTATVRTCPPETDLDELMRVMTQGRFRHVPVVDGEQQLIGIVSIGDVVKHRIDELQSERDQLTAYITG
jgi:CBS domain-containing protein